MKKFIKTKWFKIFIAFLILIILLIIIGVVSSRKASPITSATSPILKPFKSATAFVGNKIYGVNQNEEINKLRAENEKLKHSLVEYENMKKEVQMYESFLEIKKEHTDYEVVPASIIGRDAASDYTFVLDKGSTNKVKVNDPVIYGKGVLIGTVKKVYPTSCVVSTVFDPSIKISAYEITSRETGIVSSTVQVSKGKSLKMSGLKNSTVISKGGIVCTSGIGGMYPKDLIIGTVNDVTIAKNEIVPTAYITPEVDFSKLENVMILNNFKPQSIVPPESNEQK
ncbi:MAG: rod shape-determining protein MreC [Clostridia bacterium]|nr:rod shape-determining protein MreC [Clostridia bacterium]